MKTRHDNKTNPHRSTGRRGLDFNSLPMKLWKKSKKLGIWDPEAIDLTQDQKDWHALSPLDQEATLQLTTLFLGGEEAVTLDLLPLVQVIADQGRLEEEMFLTAFLREEAKHVEAFRRWIDEVPGEQHVDLQTFYTPSYQKVFLEELPQAMQRLEHDASPEAIARASVTYNMIVEGTLAETGYFVYLTVMEELDLMPGLREMIAHLIRDESRHIAYGVHLLTRLVEENGEPMWEVIEDRMSELLLPSLRIINEILSNYEETPFGLDPSVYLSYAVNQFQKRLNRIRKARPPRPTLFQRLRLIA
jgi:ribonucleoside-diphosphate reductase beta chain